MFTIYIHILEVCAMNIDGASMVTIGNMGLCFSMPDLRRGVRSLEKEGFITRCGAFKGRVYKITDKAIEYCETVARKCEQAERDSKVLGVVYSVPKIAIAPTQDAITGVLTTPNDVTIQFYTEVTGRCESCDHYVEHHYALCDFCLDEAAGRMGLDAYAYFAMPLDMKIAQQFNPETSESLDSNMPYHMPVDNSDIPF